MIAWFAAVVSYLETHVNAFLLFVTLVYVIVTWLILRQNRKQVSLMRDQLAHSNYNSFEATVLQIDAHFVAKSDIRSYFYAGKEIIDSDPLQQSVASMAEIMIDFFDHILTVVEHNSHGPDHWSKAYWEKWIIEMFSNSPAMRRYLANVKEWYPPRLSELAEEGSRYAETRRITTDPTTA